MLVFFKWYLAFVKLSNVIIFSWKVGVLVFAVPLLFYFSYLAFHSAMKNEIARMNNKLANVLAVIAIFGAVVSFFLSMYISYSLDDRGYLVCQKISWMGPNKYVKDIAFCDEW
ncbi:putative membrane protein [Pectobacterium atrosepticum SCRI1043]|uniref:Membrane protein n=1 Tax=Pectobacterium atrosepticum (strain SCRI 1043 / ATCC BAA-672) TaxID=218491 RepID=Q6D0X6_PECAS|nr:putative membrane protein [Pectobacterium atrosepticum SCRI1043]